MAPHAKKDLRANASLSTVPQVHPRYREKPIIKEKSVSLTRKQCAETDNDARCFPSGDVLTNTNNNKSHPQSKKIIWGCLTASA